MDKILTKEDYQLIGRLYEFNLLAIREYDYLAELEFDGKTDGEQYKNHKSILNLIIKGVNEQSQPFLQDKDKLPAVIEYVASFFELLIREKSLDASIDVRTQERRAATKMIAFFNHKSNIKIKRINDYAVISTDSVFDQDFLVIFIKLLSQEVAKPQRILDRKALIDLKYNLCSYNLDLENYFCESPTAEFEGEYDQSDKINQELNCSEKEWFSTREYINAKKSSEITTNLYLDKLPLGSYKAAELILRASFVSLTKRELSALKDLHHDMTDNTTRPAFFSATGIKTIDDAFKSAEKDKSTIAEAKKQAKLRKEKE